MDVRTLLREAVGPTSSRSESCGCSFTDLHRYGSVLANPCRSHRRRPVATDAVADIPMVFHRPQSETRGILGGTVTKNRCGCRVTWMGSVTSLVPCRAHREAEVPVERPTFAWLLHVDGRTE